MSAATRSVAEQVPRSDAPDHGNAKLPIFTCLATWAAREAGKAHTFFLALAAVLVWAVTGPIFGFSETWQLVINTGTTIVTFLMVFLIQSSQNRDTQALQLKLDELIRATEGARNALMNLEDRSEEDLEALKRELTSPDDRSSATP